MKRGNINIPLSTLGANLAEADRIKSEMTELLRELEEKATGQTISHPGRWRHNTAKYAKDYKLD